MMILYFSAPFTRLMPCSRHNSGTGVPFSARLTMAMIWLSVNMTQLTVDTLARNPAVLPSVDLDWRTHTQAGTCDHGES